MYISVTSYSAVERATAWKRWRCEHCAHEWEFLVDHVVSGESMTPYNLNPRGAQVSARIDAAKVAERVIARAVPKHPCPRCGRYAEAHLRAVSSERDFPLVIAGGVGLFGGLCVGAIATVVASIPAAIVATLLVAGGIGAFVWKRHRARTFEMPPALAARYLAAPGEIRAIDDKSIATPPTGA